MDLSDSPINDILYLNPNQDQSMIVVGTETGFRVFQVDPFKKTFERSFEGASGLGIVSMLYRSNILALVGGGRNPRFQPHKLMLWDDRHPRPIAELSFRTSVKAVKMRRDSISVAIESKVYFYRFSDLQLLDHSDTFSNPKGLLQLSSGNDTAILVSLAAHCGKLAVTTYDCKKMAEFTSAPSDSPSSPTSSVPANAAKCKTKTIIISAHDSPIAAIGLNFEGTRVATASEKGTIIRIFDSDTGLVLQELRRGLDKADIYCLCFNLASEWLAVTSDKGTVHLYTLKKPNNKSSLSFLGGYFQSEWSFAQFRVPDYRSICVFCASEPYTIAVFCADGSYYKAKWEPLLGGEMVKVGQAKFE
jgi:WD repeat-containing protein 45